MIEQMDGPHMLDVASLTQPIAADDPCGPDLDAIGDVQYLNFFAGAESLLPMSFFEVVNANGERGRFDPKAVDFAGQFAAAQPILARTRDLRLNLLLAKFSILNRDLDGFLCCLKATNLLLREQWEAVHPKGEDGDYALRAVTVEAIDVFPTVINPLQFLPLIENRRHGNLNYRAYQIAHGEIPAGDADADGPDLAAIERIVSETDLDTLKAASGRCSAVAAEIAGIKQTWHEKLNAGQPISLDRLSGLVNGMAAWLAGLVASRDPAATAATAEDVGPVDTQAPSDTTGGGDFIRTGIRSACSGGRLFCPNGTIQPGTVAGASSAGDGRQVIYRSHADADACARGERCDQHRAQQGLRPADRTDGGTRHVALIDGREQHSRYCIFSGKQSASLGPAGEGGVVFPNRRAVQPHPLFGRSRARPRATRFSQPFG
ncbi:hypothetical protein ABIF20_004948 [Bradyrhizobium japonicum]|uniref:type VI secretion system protein TssA n=1 Tax=Bradyrhizobium japonicum TaxID=375 RepID=UPI0038370337